MDIYVPPYFHHKRAYKNNKMIIQTTIMKKLILLLIITSAIKVQAQCLTPSCQANFTFPLDVNNYNNNPAQNKCISGNGTFTNNLNEANNWHDWSFNGIIDIQQTININGGKRLYLSGDITLQHFSMAGGSDSAIIYVGDNTNVNATNNVQNPNNFYNYVFLGQNSTFTMNGINYSAGMTYQGQGNLTNVVHFLSCNNTPLGIEEFRFNNGLLIWDLKRSGVVNLEISQDGKNFEVLESLLPTKLVYYVINTGYYRITTNNYTSKIIPILIEKDQVKRVILYKVPGLNIYGTKIIR